MQSVDGQIVQGNILFIMSPSFITVLLYSYIDKVMD